MTRFLEITAPGGPEVFSVNEIELPPPAQGEVRIRQEYSGINFVDVYHRTGLYPLPGTRTPGVEAAGIVEAVGPGVSMLPGERVAYAGLPVGSYAHLRNIPAERLVVLPPDVSTRTAAAIMLKGITAHMLLRKVYPVTEGTSILVHAAAGGLGLIITQWAKLLGAKVIGTVGSREKAEIAMAHGADHVVLYRQEDFVEMARHYTNGMGVDYAIDGIGGENLLRTFDAVRHFGTVASIGQVGGAIAPLDVFQIGPKRSLALARPSVLAYAGDLPTYREAASDLFAALQRGLKANISGIYAFDAIADAHADLERGATTGSLLLSMA